MDEHRDEEDGVEVRDDGRGADACAPGEAHDPVGDVVRLAAVRPPAGGEQLVARRGGSSVKVGQRETGLWYSPVLRLDVRRILDRVAGQLREGLAELGDALLLHLEVALLRHGGVEATTDSEQLSGTNNGRKLYQ